jgi:hypothetical protein
VKGSPPPTPHGRSKIASARGLPKNGNAAVEDVVAGMHEGVAGMRVGIPGIRVIGGTVVSALGSTIASGAHGFPEQDAKRKALNDFIRSSGVFDGVVDFDAATLDPSTGGIKPEFATVPPLPPDRCNTATLQQAELRQAVSADEVLLRSCSFLKERLVPAA